MTIKKGDKVRFLNDVGGGVVTRIIGNMAYVEDADGFEIPAQLNQIVLVEKRVDKATSKGSSSNDIKPGVQSFKSQSEEPCSFVALLQGEAKGSQSGSFRLYYVNDTPNTHQVYIFSSTTNEGVVELMYQCVVNAFTNHLLDKIPGKLLDSKSLFIQVISFNPVKAFSLQEPIVNEIKLRSSRLFNEGSYNMSGYFNEKALLFPLMRTKLVTQIEKLQETFHDKDNFKPKTTAPKSNMPKRGETIEIDLHIASLIDDIRGLSNSEILQIQIKKFVDTIDTYQAIKGLRIVFIHGVGSGVLKQEILKLLKTKYKDLYYQDASFKEYGYGATMVIL